MCTFSFALLSSKSGIYALTNLSIYYLVENVYVECTCTLLSTYLLYYLFTTSTYLFSYLFILFIYLLIYLYIQHFYNLIVSLSFMSSVYALFYLHIYHAIYLQPVHIYCNSVHFNMWARHLGQINYMYS